MYQYDDPTCVATLPTPAASGTPGYFTNGSPGTGQAATILSADYMNAVMLELLNVVKAAGLSPSKTSYSQVVTAIKALTQQGAANVGIDTGMANACVVAFSPVLTAPVPWAPFWFEVANTNTGASTLNATGTAYPLVGAAHAPLQGGELVAKGNALVYWNPTLNSGAGAYVLIECTGGAVQIAAATRSQHAIQAAQAAGVIGGVRNLVMSVAVASTSATMTADEIIVESALGGIRYCLPSFNKTINLTSTGAGGMDAGAAPILGYVGLYAIYNPITVTVALLATNATSSAVGNAYGGANMPAGYTASALVSVWPTDASGNFLAGYQEDRTFWRVPQQAFLTSGIANSFTPFGISSLVPPNARTVGGTTSMSSTAASLLGISVAGNAAGIGQSNTGTTSGGLQSYKNVPLITPQLIYYQTASSSGSPTFQLNISEYTF